jgi:hypothetical protein
MAPSKKNEKKIPLLSITFLIGLREVVTPLEREKKTPIVINDIRLVCPKNE